MGRCKSARLEPSGHNKRQADSQKLKVRFETGEVALRIAIDDFGTGYSSLEYLGRFPVDCIKIAQNFTFNLTTNSRNAEIVKAAIGMAHELARRHCGGRGDR
jgi:EAL domain-containing protein (putative c-di-GMP-specific phosphodiesterase class I)